MPIEVTYCVVNTEQRELLLRNLDALAREREAVGFDTEVLVLDNASGDGSAEAARAHPAVDGVIALDERTAKTWNDSELLRRAKGRYGLLLNEDSELLPGATRALYDALEARPRAAAAVAKLMRPDGRVQPSAWRFPGVRTAVVGAAVPAPLRHRPVTGDAVREVDWAQSAALLVRAEAAARGRLPRHRVLRLRRGGRLLPAPRGRRLVDALRPAPRGDPPRAALDRRGARAPHRRVLAQPRAVHEPARVGADARSSSAGSRRGPTRSARAAALVLPGHDPRRYWRHVRATLHPDEGEGLREAAERHNRERA